MTPSNGQATRKVTRTVFDLTAFDDVKLEKTVTLPTKPTTLEEALQAAGNDTAKLLDLIHEGLISEAVEKSREDISGFKVVGEDGQATEAYDGKFADEEKGKKINAAILALAKMNGFEKSLPKDKKAALKEKATEFLRSNPAMLAGMQG
jgi:hypothetical protein